MDSVTLTNHNDHESLLLSILPSELRTIIYSLVLAPTGRITIHPQDSSNSDKPCLVLYPNVWPYPSVNRSIRRTCRQIHRETRGIFWQWNTLVVNTEHLCNPPFVSGLYTSWEQLRRIEIQFGLSVGDVESVLWFLQPLEALSKRGRLREVLFAIGGMGTLSKFGAALKPQFGNDDLAKVEAVYELLRAASDPKDGRLPHLRRSLDLRLGLDAMSAKSRKEWFREHPPALCEEAFREMHTSLRGDVTMDGILCYRDNLRLRASFEELADNGDEEESRDG